MKNTLMISTTVLALFVSAGAMAEDAKKIDLDAKGDRIEQRLDNKGDRIDNRLDNKGDRVDNRLDAKGDRIDQRFA